MSTDNETFHVYIIQNKQTDEYYCGQTNNLDQRLEDHNREEYTGTQTTKRGGDWTLVWSHKCDSRGEARKLENKIKSTGVKRFYQRHEG